MVISNTGKLNTTLSKIFKINYWWLIVISILLRVLPLVLSPGSSLVDLKRVCFIASYVLLLFTLLKNTHIKGVKIIFLGIFLNFVVILANLGFMPVSPETRVIEGKILHTIQPGEIVLTGSGGIILPAEQTRLWFLSDIITAPNIGVAFSIGDIIIGIGILVTCISLVYQTMKIVRKSKEDSQIESAARRNSYIAAAKENGG